MQCRESVLRVSIRLYRLSFLLSKMSFVDLEPKIFFELAFIDYERVLVTTSDLYVRVRLRPYL